MDDTVCIVKGVIRKVKGGYGFIAGYDGKDYFMHWTAMKKNSTDFRQLAVGDRVEFTPIDSSRGPRAIEVLVVG
jgi:CspA family cold shock protein